MLLLIEVIWMWLHKNDNPFWIQFLSWWKKKFNFICHVWIVTVEISIESKTSLVCGKFIVSALYLSIYVCFFLLLCVNANNEWPRSQAIDSESFKYLNNSIVNFPWSNHNNSPPAKLSAYSRGGTISMEMIEKCFFINEIYTIVYHSNFDRRQYLFFFRINAKT